MGIIVLGVIVFIMYSIYMWLVTGISRDLVKIARGLHRVYKDDDDNNYPL